MSKHPHPLYKDKNSIQTLRQGLEEYYALNPNVTDPRKLPPEFAKILLAHDISHITYGCDTGMYDELKLLPLTWWTSNYKFHDHLRTIKDPTISPAIRVMYDDLIEEHGLLWLYSSIFLVLSILLPELIVIWFKTRQRQRYVPFLNFEPLLDKSLLEIRQEFDLLPLIK
ncbi:hypothetical protein I8752_29960 [Nostocaceae cyanobacterium CENA369]|uniref:Uncharacterized protein n=1 Tax=Dendronalium phyllosphericum CENA369 TaxID=1725256 RepID=A0A8J7IFC0_9NOST|nr:hypothetical protein [Dendronalium phyllosphericum]MBH8577130.1 hypothetical protein [Dendronalium phyllosphericum CENA369]